MDSKKRSLLQIHQKAIIQDLDVNYIMDDIFTRNAISSTDYDVLLNMTHRTDRTRHLLETLIQRGTNDSYDAFVNSLYKDYKWLYEKLSKSVSFGELHVEDSFEDNLSKGDVPRIPKHYVRRLRLEAEILSRLSELRRHNVLVLHGMLGSGKSALATSVLRYNQTLINERFGGIVIWLHLADCKTDDEILAQQMRLLRKAYVISGGRDSTINSSLSLSSISSNNMDSFSLTSVDQTWPEFRDNLKAKFSDNLLKECLIVLDDVNDPRVCEAFDIGCKLLVTTRDINVITISYSFISINSSFTEQETLQLFASCLDISVSELPEQARKLHHICEGGIFQLSLLGAQLAENKERLLHNKKHWNHYVASLRQKDHRLFSHWSTQTSKPIEMVIINSLQEPLLSNFKQLAVLPDNVKISAKVFSTIWNKSMPETESMLKLLKSKTLVNEYFMSDQSNYVYEIHTLILTTLRSYFTTEALNKLHVELLKNYKLLDVTTKSVDLVDDGYIAMYLAYHLLNTANGNNEWSLFNKLFLDLKFLGKKIRLTGQADVISDLRIYEDKICKTEIDRELHRELLSFLGTYGNDLYRYPLTDLVQTVLEHLSSGVLYRKAYDIAQTAIQNGELYFNFIHEQNVEQLKPSTIDVNEEVSVVRFLRNFVLVGTKTGNIKVYNIHTFGIVCELNNSSESSVRDVQVCPTCPSKVACLTDDGTITIWCIEAYQLSGYSLSGFNEELSDEDEEISCDSSKIIIDNQFEVHINCLWANNRELLIAHTNKKLLTYDVEGNVLKVYDDVKRGVNIRCICLSYDDRYIYMGCDSHDEGYSVDVIYLENYDKLMTLSDNRAMKQIVYVPLQFSSALSNRIMLLYDNDIVENTWELYNGRVIQTSIRSQTVYSTLSCDNITLLSCVINKEGILMFVAQSNGQVVCVDLRNNRTIFNLDNRRGNVVSMDVSELWTDDAVSTSDVLLTGTVDIEHVVKLWYVDSGYIAVASNDKYRKARLTSRFDVNFRHRLSSSPQTPTSNTPPPHQSTFPRNNSLVLKCTPEKKTGSLRKTPSLDKHTLKPLNLNGIANSIQDFKVQPLLAVVDDNNSIQIMRGRRIIGEIIEPTNSLITHIQISHCNLYIMYALKSGIVKKYTIRSKLTVRIMDLNSPIIYFEFINSNLLMVSSKNRCVMAYKIGNGDLNVTMLTKGNANLGSQEILNDLNGGRKQKTISDSDSIRSGTSEGSISKYDRTFPTSDKNVLYRGSQLVKCFWLEKIGMISVEQNATVKLWSEELVMKCVLHGRQSIEFNCGFHMSCCAMRNKVLVLCDAHGKFQIFKLKEKNDINYLYNIHESKLWNKIVSCDISRDSKVLALGLDNGNIVLWSITARYQITLLRHHKSPVQKLLFSPCPLSQLSWSNTGSPISPGYQSAFEKTTTPTVLVSVGSQIVWWNVTHIVANRQKGMSRLPPNVMTPVFSPSDYVNSNVDFTIKSVSSQHFFDEGDDWETLWRGKRFKQGSKNEDILSCIKLMGVNAENLYTDENFSIFVTIDTTGCVHIMNVMVPEQSLTAIDNEQRTEPAFT